MTTDERFFRVSSFALVVLGVGISGYYRLRAERQGGALPSHPTGKVANPVRAAVGAAVLTAFGIAFVAPDWAVRWSFPIPVPLRWFGLSIVAAAVPLIWWTFRSLGTNVSPTTATRAAGQLVTFGPYRWIRHPIYTAGLALLIGTGLVLGSWIIIGLIAATAAFIPYRVRREEAQLLASYGDQYRHYADRTGRFLPRAGPKPIEDP